MKYDVLYHVMYSNKSSHHQIYDVIDSIRIKKSRNFSVRIGTVFLINAEDTRISHVEGTSRLLITFVE